jgi:hypothetical protein
MAVRQVSETDSLDKLRTEFNLLASSDFGDIATLDSTLSATSVIGAVNEINAIAIAAAGFILSDGSNTQAVASGNTMLVTTGTGLTATVSSPDTLNLSLNTNLSGLTSIDIANTAEIANIAIGTSSITSASGTIDFGNEQLNTTGGVTAGGTLVGAGLTINGASIQFEGATSDSFETTLRVDDPTADRVITLPDVTGTVITTGDTGSVTGTMLANSAVSTNQIADNSVTVAKLSGFSTATLTVDTLVANTITGVASSSNQVALTSDNTSNATRFLTFADAGSGNQALKTDSALYYNPATNTLTTTATQANYADLAEKYLTDKEYPVGTVLCIGGPAEVTQCVEDHCSKVIGVVSEKPAFTMNSSLEGTTTMVAMTGRVPVRICGKVRKGDMIVSCSKPGCGRPEPEPRPGTLIGKSLVNDDREEERLIEIVVGK